MVLTKEVKVYSKMVKIEDLSLNSHKLVSVSCDICSFVRNIKYMDYNKSVVHIYNQ